MLDTVFTTTSDGTVFTISNFLIAIGVALILGFIVSLCYILTQKDKNPSHSFALTLVMLPAVIAIIIFFVGNNVARAFSLAGVFTIVRFRSTPGDPKNITYVLLTSAIGLACGLGFVVYAAIAAVILCGVMILLEMLKIGKSKTISKMLKITMPEDLDYENALDDILKKYTTTFTLQKIKTTNLGSLYELSYSIITPSDINQKEFIDALRCRNGNLNITLVLAGDTGEF